MVGDNVYFEELTRVVKIVDAVEEPADYHFLFVSGNKESKGRHRSTAVSYRARTTEAGGGQEKQVERYGRAYHYSTREEYDETIPYQ